MRGSAHSELASQKWLARRINSRKVDVRGRRKMKKKKEDAFN